MGAGSTACDPHISCTFLSSIWAEAHGLWSFKCPIYHNLGCFIPMSRILGRLAEKPHWGSGEEIRRSVPWQRSGRQRRRRRWLDNGDLTMVISPYFTSLTKFLERSTMILSQDIFVRFRKTISGNWAIPELRVPPLAPKIYGISPWVSMVVALDGPLSDFNISVADVKSLSLQLKGSLPTSWRPGRSLTPALLVEKLRDPESSTGLYEDDVGSNSSQGMELLRRTQICGLRTESVLAILITFTYLSSVKNDCQLKVLQE